MTPLTSHFPCTHGNEGEAFPWCGAVVGKGRHVIRAQLDAVAQFHHVAWQRQNMFRK